MTEAEIIEKVRKLLKLGKSTNEHEAARALEHALRLAALHKIDVAALALDPELEKIIDRAFPCGKRLSYVAKLALNVCTGFFHVNVVVSKPSVVFIGTPSDVAIAHYVLDFVTGACNRCLRTFEKESRRKRSLNQRRNFIAGFFYGLRTHLRQSKETQALEDSKFALLLAAESIRRDQHEAQLFPRTHALARPKIRHNQSAVVAGFLQGEKTMIHQPLNGSQPILRLT